MKNTIRPSYQVRYKDVFIEYGHTIGKSLEWLQKLQTTCEKRGWDEEESRDDRCYCKKAPRVISALFD